MATSNASTDSTEPTEDDGRRPVLRAGWELREVTADGTEVALRVSHGACDGYVGPEVVEDGPDAVEIRIAYQRPVGVQECSAEELIELETVRLPTRLGDRELRGCRSMGSCQRPDAEAEWNSNRGLAVTEGVVVTVVDDGILGLDERTGEEIWRVPHDPAAGTWLEQPTALGQVVLIVDQVAAEGVIALDPGTGEELWRASGRNPFAELSSQVTATGSLVLLAPRGGGSEPPTTGSVEARRPDGSVAWSTTVEGQVFQTSLSDGHAIIVSGRSQDGQQLGWTVLTALDPLDGTTRWEAVLPGQPFGVVPRPDEDVLVADVLGATYGLELSTGEELWRQLPLNYGGITDVGSGILPPPGPLRRPVPADRPADRGTAGRGPSQPSAHRSRRPTLRPLGRRSLHRP
ncbi:PQQ-binding-like beta-propeller repeat protein [Euzebya tangerina]|uniref:outer membrane protein assembly factor BamB family protein n=1 Tax=Euzebya tangerina TaxID=591198 RepID=UPI0013C34B8D|nr:PQQ-binding-like beta-propeller repeat protein [Euzebya tangerina]